MDFSGGGNFNFGFDVNLANTCFIFETYCSSIGLRAGLQQEKERMVMFILLVIEVLRHLSEAFYTVNVSVKERNVFS